MAPRAVRRRLVLLSGLSLPLLVGLAPPAWAHGDAEHGAASAARAAPQQEAWGIAGSARAVSRTVEVRMGDDMRFVPDRLEVRQGQTLRFVIRNTGRTMHEFVIGTPQALDEHAALMLRFPNMAHEEAYMAHVAPGRRGEVVWTFNRAGDFRFACLIAGHYQAGMVGSIRVTPAAAGRRPTSSSTNQE